MLASMRPATDNAMCSPLPGRTLVDLHVRRQRRRAGWPGARTDALEAECTGLVALGARRVHRLEVDGINGVRIVMQDPEGNEFCLD
jgi:Glyoxalase-like domain